MILLRRDVLSTSSISNETVLTVPVLDMGLYGEGSRAVDPALINDAEVGLWFPRVDKDEDSRSSRMVRVCASILAGDAGANGPGL